MNTAQEKLSALCAQLEALHGYSYMAEIWIDCNGAQRIVLKYSKPSDSIDEPLRTWFEVEGGCGRLAGVRKNSVSLGSQDFNELVRVLCEKSLEGTE